MTQTKWEGEREQKGGRREQKTSPRLGPLWSMASMSTMEQMHTYSHTHTNIRLQRLIYYLKIIFFCFVFVFVIFIVTKGWTLISFYSFVCSSATMAPIMSSYLVSIHHPQSTIHHYYHTHTHTQTIFSIHIASNDKEEEMSLKET